MPPPTGPAPSTPAGSRVVRIGGADRGRTVALRVGDRLQVTLSGALPPWRLVEYPRAVLRLERPTLAGRWSFLVVAGGDGPVRFARPGCAPRLGRVCPGVPPPVDPGTAAGSAVYGVQVRVS